MRDTLSEASIPHSYSPVLITILLALVVGIGDFVLRKCII